MTRKPPPLCLLACRGPALPQRRQHLEGVSFPPAELQKGKSPPRSVQGLSLQEVDRPQQQLQEGPPPPLRRQCPALGALTNLTGLNLSNNAFTSVPTCLAKLTKLAFLDLSGNLDLQVGVHQARAQLQAAACFSYPLRRQCNDTVLGPVSPK